MKEPLGAPPSSPEPKSNRVLSGILGVEGRGGVQTLLTCQGHFLM